MIDKQFMPEDHMEELYNSKNPCVKWFYRKKLMNIRKAIPRFEQLKILDAGCGEGHVLKCLYDYLPLNKYFGLDATPVALQKARKRLPLANFRRGDICNLPYKAESFDVVLCTDVLEHVTHYKIALMELQRVLSKNGTLILSFPNELNTTIVRFFLGRQPAKILDHYNSLSPEKIKALLPNLSPFMSTNIPIDWPFALSLATVQTYKRLINFRIKGVSNG